MNILFLLFYSPTPRNQVRILIHRYWSIWLAPQRSELHIVIRAKTIVSVVCSTVRSSDIVRIFVWTEGQTNVADFTRKKRAPDRRIQKVLSECPCGEWGLGRETCVRGSRARIHALQSLRLVNIQGRVRFGHFGISSFLIVAENIVQERCLKSTKTDVQSPVLLLGHGKRWI